MLLGNSLDDHFWLRGFQLNTGSHVDGAETLQHFMLSKGTPESPRTHAGPYLMLSVLFPLEPRRGANLRAKGVYMN